MESMVERFVRYTSINTRSNEESTNIPSTQTQVDFATNVLVPDLKAMVLSSAHYMLTLMRKLLPSASLPIWIQLIIMQKILNLVS